VRIEFVNHASFLVESRGVRLLCDPWLEGTAFNDSWALLAESRFQPDDFASVTHLWHSHEHPDHFSPRTLGAIPAGVRARIPFLYQETLDHKVADFARKLGFPVRELASGRWHQVAPGLRIRIGAWRNGDSWLCVHDGETTLLNLNDCAIDTAEDVERIRSQLGGLPIDVLFTQFSLSAWEGNPEEVERRRAGARCMLERAALQTRILSPRFVVPFASFVWFCHEENFYMNREMNRIDDAAGYLAGATSAAPVVLYPGDAWVVGAAHDSQASIERYLADTEDIHRRERKRARAVTESELLAESRAFCVRIADPLRLRLHLAAESMRRRDDRGWVRRTRDALRLLALGHDEPVAIYLWDHGTAYRFSLFTGLTLAALTRETCQVELGSESLHYAFQMLWGGATLQINGRFREIRPGARLAFLKPFWLAEGLNRGLTLSWRELVRRRALALSRRGRRRGRPGS
jgi:hypothetical protein